MLVLSRKLNEKIVIDGGIVVTVVKIDRNQVRLGIERPETCASSARKSSARATATAERARASRSVPVSDTSRRAGMPVPSRTGARRGPQRGFFLDNTSEVEYVVWCVSFEFHTAKRRRRAFV